MGARDLAEAEELACLLTVKHVPIPNLVDTRADLLLDKARPPVAVRRQESGRNQVGSDRTHHLAVQGRTQLMMRPMVLLVVQLRVLGREPEKKQRRKKRSGKLRRRKRKGKKI
jgi:hypothetical protein